MVSIMASAPKPKTFAQEGGHWYTRTGDPMYEVIGKNGNKRATTIRDAREHKLVPSVSTIMKLEAKPQLTNWLVQQGMLACLTLPRIAGEDDTQFIRRALEDSKAQVIKAAERGQYLHGLMEDWLRVGMPPTNRASEDDLAFVRPTVEWIYDMFPGYIWYPEASFAYVEGGLGFGGKRDLCGEHPSNRPVVIDYKCKDFARGSDKTLAYDEHVTQLSAYGRTFGVDFTAVNLFVSTRDAGAFVPCYWDQQQIDDGWKAFKALLSLWYARNDL
jgi:hypothetical protein